MFSSPVNSTIVTDQNKLLNLLKEESDLSYEWSRNHKLEIFIQSIEKKLEIANYCKEEKNDKTAQTYLQSAISTVWLEITRANNKSNYYQSYPENFLSQILTNNNIAACYYFNMAEEDLKQNQKQNALDNYIKSLENAKESPLLANAIKKSLLENFTLTEISTSRLKFMYGPLNGATSYSNARNGVLQAIIGFNIFSEVDKSQLKKNTRGNLDDHDPDNDPNEFFHHHL